MPHEHQAHASKAAGQEILQRADGLRLVCHGLSASLHVPCHLAALPQSQVRLRRPFTHFRVGGARTRGRSGGGPRLPRGASALGLLPASAPPPMGVAEEAGLAVMRSERCLDMRVGAFIQKDLSDVNASSSGLPLLHSLGRSRLPSAVCQAPFQVLEARLVVQHTSRCLCGVHTVTKIN